MGEEMIGVIVHAALTVIVIVTVWVIVKGGGHKKRKAEEGTFEELNGESVQSNLAKINRNIKGIGDRIDKLDRRLNEVEVNQLRLVFLDQTAPPEERMLAGLKYVVEREENGSLKEAVLEYVKECEDVYWALVCVKQHLRLSGIERRHDRADGD